MRKIAEVTYSYTNINPETKEKLSINEKEINLNTTIFISLRELDLNIFSSLSDEEKIKLIKKSSKIVRKKINPETKEKLNINEKEVNLNTTLFISL
jgi:hypothetical protein